MSGISGFKFELKKRMMDILMPVLPKDDLSHLIGKIVHYRLPEPLAAKSVEWFAKYFKINLDEAELPLNEYRSIGELFIRKLKPSVRPLGLEPVHCADALITESGRIENQTLIQAKGRTYSVSDLLRNRHWSGAFEGGSFFTYYLCPTDYHRVHSPVAGEIELSCHVPGELWPVNAWSVNSISHLFAINERVAVFIKTPLGMVAVVMVAATNVGNMSFAFDPHLGTSRGRAERAVKERSYQPPHFIQHGDELGIFHMGSTVIVLFEKSVFKGDPESFRGQMAKMGSSLIVNGL